MGTGPLLDTFLVYQFIKRLVTPFDETDAFKLGLIDASGKRLRQPRTDTERGADTPFDRLVFNLKRLIEKVPGGHSKFASWAAALLLIREQDNAAYWNTRPQELAEAFNRTYLTAPAMPAELAEDVAINNVGSGAVAGLGVGPQGEPGVFAGHRVFKVKPEHYYKARFGKKKFSNYKHWVGEDAVGQEIRKYANENMDKPVIIQNQLTGAMMFLRRGKKGNF